MNPSKSTSLLLGLILAKAYLSTLSNKCEKIFFSEKILTRNCLKLSSKVTKFLN